MDSSKFDDLTKALATSTSRRQALKALGASVVGGILGLSGIDTALAKKPLCRGNGSKCSLGQQCCSGYCANNVCTCPPAPACNRACPCPSDSTCQNGTCVATTTTSTTTTSTTTTTPMCLPGGSTCLSNSQCCSDLCCTGIAGVATCCPTGTVCLNNGTCATLCTSDADCSSGCSCAPDIDGVNFCTSGGVGTTCIQDIDCPTGLFCAIGAGVGVCLTAC